MFSPVRFRNSPTRLSGDSFTKVTPSRSPLGRERENTYVLIDPPNDVSFAASTVFRPIHRRINRCKKRPHRIIHRPIQPGDVSIDTYAQPKNHLTHGVRLQNKRGFYLTGI